MIMGADAPWCEFGQFKRSSTKGGFRQKVHRCRRNKDVSSAAKQATTGLTRRLKLDPRSSKRDLRPVRTRCTALARVSSLRRPRFLGLDPRVIDGVVPLPSPPIRLLPARDSRRLERAVGFRRSSLAGLRTLNGSFARRTRT